MNGWWGVEVGRDRDLSGLIDETARMRSREIAISMIGDDERWIWWCGCGVELGWNWVDVGRIWGVLVISQFW